MTAVQRLSPLTFGLILWHSEKLVLSEADLRRHEVAVELVRKELDVLVVLIDSGLKRRKGRGKTEREKRKEREEREERKEREKKRREKRGRKGRRGRKKGEKRRDRRGRRKEKRRERGRRES